MQTLKSIQAHIAELTDSSSFARSLGVALAALSMGSSSALAQRHQHGDVSALLERANNSMRASSERRESLETQFQELEHAIKHEDVMLDDTKRDLELANRDLSMLDSELALHTISREILTDLLNEKNEDMALHALNEATRQLEGLVVRGTLMLRSMGANESEANFIVAKSLAITALEQVDFTQLDKKDRKLARNAVEKAITQIQNADANSAIGKSVSKMTPERAAILASVSFSKQALNEVPVLNSALCLIDMSVGAAFQVSRAYGALMVMSSGAMAPGSPSDIRMNFKETVNFSLDGLYDEFKECLRQTTDSWERHKNHPRMYDRRSRGGDGPGDRHDYSPRERSPKDNNPKNDGPKNSGPKDRGPKNDGPRDRGPRNDGPRNDGPRNDGGGCDPSNSCCPGGGMGIA